MRTVKLINAILPTWPMLILWINVSNMTNIGLVLGNKTDSFNIIYTKGSV